MMPQIGDVLATANMPFFRMLVNIHHISHHHIPEDSNLHNVNHKSHLLTITLFSFVYEQDLTCRTDFLNELLN
jgi:hypothetical protein